MSVKLCTNCILTGRGTGSNLEALPGLIWHCKDCGFLFVKSQDLQGVIYCGKTWESVQRLIREDIARMVSPKYRAKDGRNRLP